MKLINADNNVNQKNRKAVFLVGISLIIIGIILLSMQSIIDGWKIVILLPILGVIFILGGINYRKFGLLLTGTILSGLGFGLALFFTDLLTLGINSKVGVVILSFGLGWCVLPILSTVIFKNNVWWPFLPGGILLATGSCFVFSQTRFIDFVFYVVTGTGLTFLVIGLFKRWIGFIIPGCLLIGIGPGIYIPWNNTLADNGLAQTGIMLVWFALGFGLIVLFSRVMLWKFTWWPLIPGGVLAMVGWGLYIGGNPNNALNFIGNTGSIGLIILGVYLLLLRQGFD